MAGSLWIYHPTLGKIRLKNNMKTDTDSADVLASDIQANKIAFCKGAKIVGTGKSFEFAQYGTVETNLKRYVPYGINIIEIASSVYPIKLTIELGQMKNIDFSTPQKVATVTADGSDFDVLVSVSSNMLEIACDKTFAMQVFYGKDNYV